MLARQLEEEYYEGYAQQEEKVVPRRKVVKRPVKVHSTYRSKLLCLGILIAGMVGLVLASSSQLASQGYELVKIQQTTAKLEVENQQLLIGNAQLKSPNRIKDIAEKKLNMVVSDKAYFVEK